MKESKVLDLLFEDYETLNEGFATNHFEKNISKKIALLKRSDQKAKGDEAQARKFAKLLNKEYKKMEKCNGDEIKLCKAASRSWSVKYYAAYLVVANALTTIAAIKIAEKSKMFGKTRLNKLKKKQIALGAAGVAYGSAEYAGVAELLRHKDAAAPKLLKASKTYWGLVKSLYNKYKKFL